MKRIDPVTGEAVQRVDSGGERFLSRWSRLKRASRDDTAPSAVPRDDSADQSKPAVPAPLDAATGTAPAAAPSRPRDEVVAALPPVESLTIDSDYSAFFQPKVPESLRRAAVKKLFADPRFNVMDGLDTYIDDYTKPDPIPEAMLRSLNHAQGFFAPVPDPLEAHRRDVAAQAQAAPATGAQPIAQDDVAVHAESMQPAEPVPPAESVPASASVDPQAASAEAGAGRAPEAANATGSPPPTTPSGAGSARGRHSLPAPGTDPSPGAIDPTPATSERT